MTGLVILVAGIFLICFALKGIWIVSRYLRAPLLDLFLWRKSK